jgi:hypothetical protein
MQWERSCTDILCCLFFLSFVVVMGIISAIAFAQGDPLKIFTPYDSDGNQCGLLNQTLSNSTQNVGRDFTQYKYKYFTNLDSFAEGTDAFKTPKIFNAVCVKVCPSNVPQSDMGSSKRQDCMVNDDVTQCPGYNSLFVNTTAKYSYCLPDSKDKKSAVAELYK